MTIAKIGTASIKPTPINIVALRLLADSGCLAIPSIVFEITFRTNLFSFFYLVLFQAYFLGIQADI